MAPSSTQPFPSHHRAASTVTSQALCSLTNHSPTTKPTFLYPTTPSLLFTIKYSKDTKLRFKNSRERKGTRPELSPWKLPLLQSWTTPTSPTNSGVWKSSLKVTYQFKSFNAFCQNKKKLLEMPCTIEAGHSRIKTVISTCWKKSAFLSS